MRLNIGSGDHYAPGWTNVDIWPGNDPDVVADALDLPFPDGSASHVYAGHVLEHLFPAAVPVALAEFRRVLAPGGMLAVVGPDTTNVTPGTQLHRDCVHGGHRWPGDEHRWECTADTLHAHVKGVFPDAELVPITDLPETWPVVSRIWWQAAVTAAKP